MSRYFINEEVIFWKDGEKLIGIVFSAKRKMFNRIEYTIAVKKDDGFDPYGIGKEKYYYPTVLEEDIISINFEGKNK